ncbi:MLX-interacting protein isoform X2 [Chelonus insularis]|uniref:MLX-interacting protein isoform X2 n=1 Tax=Chelonus insularis TaxID=460826 RepID=UPI00158EB179|nr:MLX-interacting protein isoform X2 [Chelonus insularis]
MQAELMYRKPVMTAREMSSEHQGVHRVKRDSKDSKETIHSGHFMVSDFEAEAQDDEDELAVPVPEEEAVKNTIIAPVGFSIDKFITNSSTEKSPQQLSIETSLNKLFQCMSLAYRQKLTSPKWNRFKGIRLRWKDKIRLNNVIWRCWHMQFILKQNTLVCQFASPLDVDTHNKPEAVVLEGKYWKRKLAAVTAEYKKWRMFYRNKILGWTNKDGLESMDVLDWGGGMESSGSFPGSMTSSHGNLSGVQGPDSMMVDADYMELMTDTLFSTISSNQPIYFPDPREIARGASLADFIQPSLGPLQPNLDDFMDTLEPLQEFLNCKLPPVPEEEDIFRSGGLSSNYSDLDLMTSLNQESNQINEAPVTNNSQAPVQTIVQRQNQSPDSQNLQYTAKIYTQPQESNVYRSNTVNITENYNPGRQPYENNTVMREKIPRAGRPMTRGNRIIQQPPQQTFNQPQQVVSYSQHQAQASPRPTFNSLELQTVQINSNSTPVGISVTNQIPSVDSQVHGLITPSSFPQVPHETQQRAIKPLPVPNQISDPFKLIQPQQTYKLSTTTTLPQSFNPQYKFKANNIKSITAPVTVSVSTPSSPAQSHILLQCKPSGLDLTATPHQAKLLPRPTNILNVEKEDIFAVPKYQMKARSRSRSSSALSGPRNPPPLVSAVSDPTLNLNNNVLLAHLLTNNSSNLYTVTSGPEKIMSVSTTSTPTVKNILPMFPPTTLVGQVSNSTQITTPITIQTLSNPTPGQSQTHQRTNTQVMLNPTGQNHQTQGSPGSPNDSTSAHSPQALNISPLHSPMSIGSPLSPSRIFVKGEPERGQYKEQRRVGHIHAEQKRRYNIKNGFDMLHSLIPQLSQNPNTKLSKAAMLQKGADYIRQLRAERNQLNEEMDNLRKQIETLNTSISNCQSLLPATGAPVSRQRTSKMKEMYDEYVRKRTQENWKFWIFSKLLEPLLISFNGSVSTASIDDLCRSTMIWVEQSCSLVDLRPAVLNSLRYLCTATDILSDPSRLPEEALAAVNHTEKQRSTQ